MSLDKTLTDLHSIYIRLEATDENGNGHCKCCKTNLTYWNMACGHFIKSRHQRFKWSIMNTDGICADCNRIEETDHLAEPMRDYKVSTLGFDKVEQMEKLIHLPYKMSISEKKDLIKIRRKQIRELLKEKNFNVNVP